MGRQINQDLTALTWTNLTSLSSSSSACYVLYTRKTILVEHHNFVILNLFNTIEIPCDKRRWKKEMLYMKWAL